MRSHRSLNNKCGTALQLENFSLSQPPAHTALDNQDVGNVLQETKRTGIRTPMTLDLNCSPVLDIAASATVGSPASLDDRGR
jgi:hypothetical protein